MTKIYKEYVNMETLVIMKLRPFIFRVDRLIQSCGIGLTWEAYFSFRSCALITSG